MRNIIRRLRYFFYAGINILYYRYVFLKYYYYKYKYSSSEFVVLDFDQTLINNDFQLNRNLLIHLNKFHRNALFLILSARLFYHKRIVLNSLGQSIFDFKIIDVHLIGSTLKKANLVKILAKRNKVTYYDDLDFLGFGSSIELREQFITNLKNIDNLNLITDQELNDIISHH